MFCFLFLLSGFLQAQKPKLVVPIGHLGGVISYDLSPDGKHGVMSVDISRDGNATLTDSAYRHRPPEFRSGIISSAILPDGKFKLTGGKDKTAKLWDASGRLLQTFVGHTAQVNAVAFSPDGKLILTGSNDKTVKLWDLSGNRLQTFIGHHDYISYVGFSIDGKKILTEGMDGTAKLWDLSGRMLQEFKKYRIPTIKAPLLRGLRKLPRGMRGLFFLADDNKNVLVRTDDDTLILADSSWGVEYYKNYGMLYLRGQYDSLVPRVPSSQRLDLFKGNSYHSRRDEGDDNFYLGRHVSIITSVGFTSDKKFVVLGCGCVDHMERALDVLGRKVQIIDSTSTAWKTALTSSRDSSEKLWVFSGRMSRSFKHAKIFAFSPDYKKLLTVSKNNKAKLWDSSGKMLFQRIPNNKETTSVVFSPDGKTILIGGWDFPPLQKAKVRFMSDRDNSQELWDLSGKVVQSFKGLGLENKAAFSPACPNDPNGGGIILTTNEEMTSSLWDTKSGKLLATLFMLDSTDWVVTTPSGLFDASDNAKRLIYYTVGYESEIIVIKLEQLQERYWQPGLLGSILGLSPYPVKNVGVFDNLKLFPSIEDSTRVESNQLYIKLRERNGGMGKLSLIINGRRLEENLNPNRKKDLVIDLKPYIKSRHLRTDTLNTIELEVYESKDELKSEPYKLYYQASVKKRGEGSDEEESMANTCDAPRNLYIIVVGTSLYPQGVDSLPSANEDAAEMARVLSESGKLLYGDRVHLKLLSTKAGESPSKANIAAAFEAFKTANVCDVLVVFFAGHGSNWGKDGDKSNFYYLTQDITFGKLNDEGIRKAYAISDQELTEWMTKIPALNQLLILDACNSGQAAINMGGIVARDLDPDKIIAFNQMSGNTGSYVISGSSESGASFESAVFGHGLLTYSLLEGINGTALEGTKVDVLPLLLKSYKRVGELAKSLGEEQTPIIAKPRGNASFFVGKNDGSIKIELAETKPMVIRSFLFDQDKYNDVLDLTEAVNKVFRSKEIKGKQAQWFYSDIPKSPQGFSIRGVYSMNKDNTVTVRGSLLKGEDPVGEPFAITGTKDASVLADLIMKAVKPGIKVK